jgi:hypothetical protein
VDRRAPRGRLSEPDADQHQRARRSRRRSDRAGRDGRFPSTRLDRQPLTPGSSRSRPAAQLRRHAEARQGLEPDRVADHLRHAPEDDLHELVHGCDAVIDIATAIPTDPSVAGAGTSPLACAPRGQRDFLMRRPHVVFGATSGRASLGSGSDANAVAAVWIVRCQLASLSSMRVSRFQSQARCRSDRASQAASDTSVPSSRHDRRCPASEPASLSTRRIFVSSRRRRRPILVAVVLVALWATALMAVASVVLLVIERLFEDTRLGDGASVMAMAFVPALTLYAALVCRRCES